MKLLKHKDLRIWASISLLKLISHLDWWRIAVWSASMRMMTMGEYSLWVFCQLQDTYTCSDGAIHHSNKQAA
jgi:hypothetical protein